MSPLEKAAIAKVLKLLAAANEPVSLGLYRPNDKEHEAAREKQSQLLREAIDWISAMLEEL